MNVQQLSASSEESQPSSSVSPRMRAAKMTSAEIAMTLKSQIIDGDCLKWDCIGVHSARSHLKEDAQQFPGMVHGGLQLLKR